MNQLHFVYLERAWIELLRQILEAPGPSLAMHALVIFASEKQRYHLISAKVKITDVSNLRLAMKRR